jgi:hypothetical protein
VFAKKGKFEKDDVKTLNAVYTPTIKDEVFARDKSEELDIKKQNADNDDTRHLHTHHQEQARRV